MIDKTDNSAASDAADIIIKWLVGRAQDGKKVGQELNDINDIRALISDDPQHILGFTPRQQ